MNLIFRLASVAIPAAAIGFVVPFLLAEDDPAQTAAMSTFKCDQDLPEFTLGADSDPSEQEVDSLCACVWSEMDNAERAAFSSLLTASDGSEGAQAPSEDTVERLTASFGEAVGQCGGFNL